jgi:peptidoglycan/xylan/chitin deacetylase (PgdA/CDA1 family)
VSPKRLAKALLGQALVRGGFWQRRLRTWAERNAVIILTYHRVTRTWDHVLDYSQPGLVVTGSTFERQIVILKEHFDVVTLGALVADRPSGMRRTRPRCVITLDDGWRDNYDVAFPILQRHGLPAIVFLATDFIGSDRAFWHTELIYLFTRTELPRLLGEKLELQAYPNPVRHELERLARRGTPGARDVDTLIETVKALCNEDVIEQLIDTLSHAVGLRRPLLQERKFFLDWDQVRAMARAGFEIGSHGCSHRIMTRLPSDTAQEELLRSKAEIERRIGTTVEHFAFPNEAGNRALMIAAATAGYRTACVAEPVARQEVPEIQPLRRLGMHEGVCSDGRSFDESRFHYWLFRAPEGVHA